MKRLRSALAFALLATPINALEPDEAQGWLTGTWISQWGGETWIFEEDGQWLQIVGGATYESAIAIEARPANIFAIISETSGKTYIVHKRTDNSFTVFEEGNTAPLGAFSRHQ